MTLINNRKIFIYSSLFIALILNAPKLFALKKDGIMAHYWHFDKTELILQTLLNLLFCLCIFFYSTNDFKRIFIKDQKGKSKNILVNALLFSGFTIVGLASERAFFNRDYFLAGVLCCDLFSVSFLFYIKTFRRSRIATGIIKI